MTQEAQNGLGTAIRERRLALGLSQRELAVSAKTTPGAVCHIERGSRTPSAAMLARIAASLNCSTDNLLKGDNGEKEASGYARQVAAAMMLFSHDIQKEVVDFCAYLRHREKKGR
jgi:transcriptional regulator with XRE-family HTH domain